MKFKQGQKKSIQTFLNADANIDDLLEIVNEVHLASVTEYQAKLDAYDTEEFKSKLGKADKFDALQGDFDALKEARDGDLKSAKEEKFANSLDKSLEGVEDKYHDVIRQQITSGRKEHDEHGYVFHGEDGNVRMRTDGAIHGVADVIADTLSKFPEWGKVAAVGKTTGSGANITRNDTNETVSDFKSKLDAIDVSTQEGRRELKSLYSSTNSGGSGDGQLFGVNTHVNNATVGSVSVGNN